MVFLIPYPTSILGLTLHPTEPMLGTYLHMALGVLKTVVDPKSLFANPELSYDEF